MSRKVNRSSGIFDPRLDEMPKELRRLSSELAQLRGNQCPSRGPQRQQSQRGRSQPICWNCGERGHIRRNCHRPRREGRSEGGQRSYRSITATNNSTLVVDGLVEGRLTKMLIDSGSAVTILREDVWKAACNKPCSLDHAGPQVVVAKGGALNILGRTTVSLQIVGVKSNYPCLLTSELTQECIIGADFLLEHKCIIDLHQ